MIAQTNIAKPDLSPEQAEAWKPFEKVHLDGKSPDTIRCYNSRIAKFLRTIEPKPFNQYMLEDFKRFFEALHNETQNNRTHNNFVQFLKTFFRFYYANTAKQPFPSFFKNEVFKKRSAQPAVNAPDILSEEEVFQIVNAAGIVRNQAFIAVLFESIARLGEAVNFKIKDFKEDENGSYINKTIRKLGKKGGAGEFEVRPIILVKSLPYLKNWLQQHPQRNNPEAWLFITIHRRQAQCIGKRMAYDIVKKAARDAGISEKRVFPHLLRHSAITNDGDRGVNDKMRGFRAGWRPGSPQLRIYDHFGKASLKSQAVQLGVVKETPATDKGIECPRCKTINYYTEYCLKCSTNLKNPYESPATVMDGELQKRDAEIAKLQTQVATLCGLIEKIEQKIK